MSEPTLEHPDDPRDREPTLIGDPLPDVSGVANAVLGAHVRLGNIYWARIWGNRATERRAANSPW